ncbi:hypothetical protein [Actinophytocola sp.]|uniref:hypothetical protein n=1 Tax=Actinophytocola sp. TaxID=1872138 RepID=UPI002ED5B908
MNLPSGVGGPTTQEVGYFACHHRKFAEWLVAGLGTGWVASTPEWQSLDDVLPALAPASIMSRYACVAIDGWTLVMNNTPLGTDVGVLPSLAARELNCRGIRAARVDAGEAGYPARILEVYGPDGQPPLALERTVAAADDGGRWVFETSGTMFAFEDEAAYRRRTKASRFTGDMLHAYLLALGVPADSEPDWATAFLVESSRALPCP